MEFLKIAILRNINLIMRMLRWLQLNLLIAILVLALLTKRWHIISNGIIWVLNGIILTTHFVIYGNLYGIKLFRFYKRGRMIERELEIFTY